MFGINSSFIQIEPLMVGEIFRLVYENIWHYMNIKYFTKTCCTKLEMEPIILILDFPRSCITFTNNK